MTSLHHLSGWIIIYLSMIESVRMYRAVCDGCGRKGVSIETTCWDDRDWALQEALESGWMIIDHKLYCPDCIRYNPDTDEYEKKETKNEIQI